MTGTTSTSHLRDVLAAASDVDICAVGVGLDLSVFYDRCTALDLVRGGDPPGTGRRTGGDCIGIEQRKAVPVTERRIAIGRVGHRGTSIDEGGAVYVALRNAVESHTGKPIPDDNSTGGRAPASGRRSRACSAM